MAKRDPYPLQWPDGWSRTKRSAREQSRFGHRQSGDVSFSQARRELLDEAARLGALNVVITSDLPTRHDGLPYANGRAEDSGIAVWFIMRDASGSPQERVFACDKWRTPAENMTAIARSIAALRGLDRWGASDAVTRAFAGFNALPPGEGSEESQARSWREVFSINGLDLPNSEMLSIVKLRYREMIKTAHPDKGGSDEAAAEINTALAEAENELQGEF